MRCSITRTGPFWSSPSLLKSLKQCYWSRQVCHHCPRWTSPALFSAPLGMLWADFLQLWLTKMDFKSLPIAWGLSLSLCPSCQPTSGPLHFLLLFQICDLTRFKKVQHKYVQEQVAVFCSFHQGDLVSRKWGSRGAEDMLQTKIVCLRKPQDHRIPLIIYVTHGALAASGAGISDFSHNKTKNAVRGVLVQYLLDPFRSIWEGVRSGFIYWAWQQVKRGMFCPPARQAWAGWISLVCRLSKASVSSGRNRNPRGGDHYPIYWVTMIHLVFSFHQIRQLLEFKLNLFPSCCYFSFSLAYPASQKLPLSERRR